MSRAGSTEGLCLSVLPPVLPRTLFLARCLFPPLHLASSVSHVLGVACKNAHFMGSCAIALAVVNLPPSCDAELLGCTNGGARGRCCRKLTAFSGSLFVVRVFLFSLLENIERRWLGLLVVRSLVLLFTALFCVASSLIRLTLSSSLRAAVSQQKSALLALLLSFGAPGLLLNPQRSRGTFISIE